MSIRDAWKLCRIGKQYSFSAAHFLPLVGANHPCRRMHGHNYVVELEVRGEIAPVDGFCSNIDFFQLDLLMKPILEKIDHRTLNDEIENPTAELIAQYIMDEINKNRAILFSVKVWETPKCFAMVVNKDGVYKPEHRE